MFSPETLENSPVKPVADSLALTLELKINGKSHHIPGANIKTCLLNLASYGFDGALGFWLPADQREDRLISDFSSEHLIEVSLGIMPVHHLPDPPPKPLSTKGLVTEKSVAEIDYPDVSGRPVLYRFYQIAFADCAQVLWRQHFPCELYVEQAMSTVIKAQVVPPITLKLELPSLDDVKPMICLGLGKRDAVNTGSINREQIKAVSASTGRLTIDRLKNKEASLKADSASFYDFLINYLNHNDAVLTYDYEKQRYLISADKPAPKQTKAFLPHEIAAISSHWPETRRHSTQLLNAVADNPQKETLEQAQAVAGIRHDILVRYPISRCFTDRKRLEAERLQLYGEELNIRFAQWPLHTFHPGSGVKVNKQVWGDGALYANKQFRAHRLRIDIQAIDPSQEQDIDTEFTPYRLDYQVHAELASSQKKRLPSCCQTSYPLMVEGKIVSTIGEEGKDKTYDIVENKDTGQHEYQVHIPLWDKKIKILFEPDFLNPHFYFPFYRDNKVLIAFDLYQAAIVKVLSWGARVRLPVATQGNHILFGKNDQDETSFRHVYEESKPVLAIKRKKEKDTELVRLEEGSIILQTREEK